MRKAELLRRFAAWHDPILALVQATAGRSILRNDIVELAAPLPRFTRARVVLVGDAAHVMTPDLGQGGNQALEDAVTLAALIGHHHDVDAALDMYDTTRRQRTTAIARSSRQVGRIAQAHSPMAVALRNSLIRLLPAGASTRAAARLQTWRPPGPEIDL